MMLFDSLLCSRRLKRNLRLKSPYLQELQWKMFKAVIKYAFENVPFYHRKFDEARIKPDDIKSFADLKRVPVTEKSEIQATSIYEVVAKELDLSRCSRRATSGSTGQPLTIILSKTAKVFRDALWLRAYSENGMRFRDKFAIISEPHYVQHSRILDRLFGIFRKEYISTFDDANKQLTLLEDCEPDIIQGYPSSLMILADARPKNYSKIKPRLILTLAELLDRESRQLISSAFESDLLDNYACAEFGLLSWECRKHTGYHVNIDSVVMEFIQDGVPVSPGESGEIVITNLANYAMPLIRYQLGDVGVPIEDRCSCGVALPLMKILQGRTNDFLTALDGRIISPTVFFPYPFEGCHGIKHFRIIQERRDKLKIELIVKEDFLNNRQVFYKARMEILKLFGEDMQVEFQILEKIDRGSNGKLRKVISNVPVNFKRLSAYNS